MSLVYTTATPVDAPACVALRARTRENAISESRLRELGITAESWAEAIRSGHLTGTIARQGAEMVGYCFGSRHDGEIVVLALLPAHEGQGIGKTLLASVVAQLRLLGHARLHLGCSADPTHRSFGFYRHLGWSSTGRFDANGDEILTLEPRPPGSGA